MQSRTFREIMQQAIESLPALKGSGNEEFEAIFEAGPINISLIAGVRQLSEMLEHATDIPERAKPFIESLKKVAVHCEVFTLKPSDVEDEQVVFEKFAETCNNLQSSLNELVQSSASNNALQKVADVIRQEMIPFLRKVKKAMEEERKRSADHSTTLADLNKLFEGSQK